MWTQTASKTPCFLTTALPLRTPMPEHWLTSVRMMKECSMENSKTVEISALQVGSWCRSLDLPVAATPVVACAAALPLTNKMNRMTQMTRVTRKTR